MHPRAPLRGEGPHEVREEGRRAAQAAEDEELGARVGAEGVHGHERVPSVERDGEGVEERAAERRVHVRVGELALAEREAAEVAAEDAVLRGRAAGAEEVEAAEEPHVAEHGALLVELGGAEALVAARRSPLPREGTSWGGRACTERASAEADASCGSPE